MDRKAALEYALADAGLMAGESAVTRQGLEKADSDACHEIAFPFGEYGSRGMIQEYEREYDD